jgi:hypothetical protein
VELNEVSCTSGSHYAEFDVLTWIVPGNNSIFDTTDPSYE